MEVEVEKERGEKERGRRINTSMFTLFGFPCHTFFSFCVQRHLVHWNIMKYKALLDIINIHKTRVNIHSTRKYTLYDTSSTKTKTLPHLPTTQSRTESQWVEGSDRSYVFSSLVLPSRTGKHIILYSFSGYDIKNVFHDNNTIPNVKIFVDNWYKKKEKVSLKKALEVKLLQISIWNFVCRQLNPSVILWTRKKKMWKILVKHHFSAGRLPEPPLNFYFYYFYYFYF